MLQGIISFRPPSSPLTRSFPTEGGSLLLVAYQLFSLPPRGRGTARNERWMRDASDQLMLPNSVTLLLQRAYVLGNVSQEVRRRSRSDPDHPVNGREGGERAAGSAPGQGTARDERWMRDASDYLELPDSVTLMLQRAYKLGYVSRSGFPMLRDRGYAAIAPRHVHSARKKHFSATWATLALLAWRAS